MTEPFCNLQTGNRLDGRRNAEGCKYKGLETCLKALQETLWTLNFLRLQPRRIGVNTYALISYPASDCSKSLSDFSRLPSFAALSSEAANFFRAEEAPRCRGLGDSASQHEPYQFDHSSITMQAYLTSIELLDVFPMSHPVWVQRSDLVRLSLRFSSLRVI